MLCLLQLCDFHLLVSHCSLTLIPLHCLFIASELSSPTFSQEKADINHEREPAQGFEDILKGNYHLMHSYRI